MSKVELCASEARAGYCILHIASTPRCACPPERPKDSRIPDQPASKSSNPGTINPQIRDTPSAIPGVLFPDGGEITT
jgi:hypothetical protein